jgi:hypothetical protein
VAEPGALRSWLVDIFVGGIVGGVVGAIVAVNVVIFAGIDRGYEASIPEVFRENALVGVLTVVALASGPFLGVLVARAVRKRRGAAG